MSRHTKDLARLQRELVSEVDGASRAQGADTEEQQDVMAKKQQGNTAARQRAATAPRLTKRLVLRITPELFKTITTDVFKRKVGHLDGNGEGSITVQGVVTDILEAHYRKPQSKRVE